jgi:4-hydroxymandelate oxidase
MTIAEPTTTQFTTLQEIREAALARLDPAVRDFLEGGAGEETTLGRNRSAFGHWALQPRVMSGLGPPSLSASFLGVDLGLPILTAPFGADGLFDPEGQVAVARANALMGAASIAPEAGSHSIEEIAAAAPGAAAFGQLHPMGREENFVRMLRRFADAGYRGICVTCDCPTGGWRERNIRNRFEPTLDIVGGNYPADSETSIYEVFGQLFDIDAPVWPWSKLGDLMTSVPLPWFAKGIITPEDAVAAVAAGASGVLVSNHGGRQLDGVTASIDALPAIRDAVGPDVGIAVDSGLRRGTDIVTAIALGADVVVLGRLAVYGLAAAGQAGVVRTYELLRDELRSVLTLLGRGGIADLDRRAVRRVER